MTIAEVTNERTNLSKHIDITDYTVDQILETQSFYEGAGYTFDIKEH